MLEALASACLFQYHLLMQPANEKTILKNAGRGRPRTDSVPVMVRLQPDVLAALDAAILTTPDAPTRPEMIRRIVAAVLVNAGLLGGAVKGEEGD